MTIKIEDGVPMPETRRRGMAEELRNTLTGMKAGQSFVFEGKYQYVYAAAKAVGVKITSRKLGKNIFRVWRVE